MFKCEDCGAEFETPKEVLESRGERFGEKCYEAMEYCPYCGSGDIDEGYICTSCNRFFSDYREIAFTSNNTNTCKDCTDKLFTPELGVEYLESPVTADGKNKMLNCFFDWCLPFTAFKLALMRGDDIFKICDIQTILKEFCMEEWREFAETVL